MYGHNEGCLPRMLFWQTIKSVILCRQSGVSEKTVAEHVMD